MKRTIGLVAAACLLTLCSLLISGCAPKRNFAGTWTGTVTVTDPRLPQPISLPLTVHITKKDDGTYSSTLDSTMQKANGLPMDPFVVDGDKITTGLPLAKATFAGTTNADATEITGNWSQSGKTVPLVLKKQPDPK